MFSVFWPMHLLLGLLKAFLGVLVLLSAVFTLLAFQGERAWLWSLTTHFRVQYLTIQLIALFFASLAFFSHRRDKTSVPGSRFGAWVNLVALMVLVGLNLSQVAPYYRNWLRPPEAVADVGQPRLRLMHMNLFGPINRDASKVAAAIRAESPDLLDLVEYTERWQKDLEKSGVLKAYPYRVAAGSHIALYSKRPLRHARLTFPTGQAKVANQANIVAQVMLNQKPVTLIVAHPASPIRPSHLVWQQDMFKAWGRQRGQWGTHVVLVGDLNTTPWSSEFPRLLAATGLRDSQLEFGIQPSWPALVPFVNDARIPSVFAMPFAIPIDHVLVSPKIQVLSRRTGSFVGSDHLPVVVELALAR